MLKGDCRICIHGNEPEDSEICIECGILRKNYAPIKADEYISREAIKAAFATFVRPSNNSDFASAPTWNDAVNIVVQLPASDVEPIIHAHWMNKERYHSTLFGNCSNCGESSVADTYCSNCGAKMDEEMSKK